MSESNNNLESNFLLNNIKSKYIIVKIFENVQTNIFLNLIRYNKTFQKRLNKNIDDYKDYSKIEIEIFPEEEKYGDFINFDYYRNYYHIYFNDDEKEEKKKNYITKYDKVQKIKIKIDYEVRSLYRLFKNCECIKKINFTKFNRTNIINMSHMFADCSLLE